MYHESWIPLLIWCCFALTTSNSSLKLPKSYFFQGMLAFLGYENHKFMQTRVLPVHLLFLWGIWMHRSLCSRWYPWLWNAVLWHLKPERPYNNQAVAFAADLAVTLRCPGSSFHDLFACLRGRCRASFYDCYSSTLGSSFRCNMFGSKNEGISRSGLNNPLVVAVVASLTPTINAKSLTAFMAVLLIEFASRSGCIQPSVKATAGWFTPSISSASLAAKYNRVWSLPPFKI